MNFRVFRDRKNRYELLLFVIFFVILLYYRMRAKHKNSIQPDCRSYYIMAQDITVIFKSAILNPFCYRVLVPFLVYISPLDIDMSFIILSFVSLYFTGMVLYYTLRIKFNRILSTYGLLAFISLDIIDISFDNYYLVDSVAYFFIILCFYAIFKENNRLYLISLILGVLTKETVLFTIPVFLLYSIYFIEDEQKKIKINKEVILQVIKLSKYFAPSLIIYILLRIIIKPYPGGIYDNIFVLFIETADYHLNRTIKRPYTLGSYILTWEFIPLFFCFFIKKRDFYKWLKIYGIFMFLVFFQLSVAHSPTNRLLLVGFYPMIYLSVSGLNQLLYKETIEKKEINNIF